MRLVLLALVAILVGGLFVRNVIVLAGETSPLIWAAAALAALAGAAACVAVFRWPPALDPLRGARRGILPILAAGAAVLIVGSASTEGQLISLALFAGFLVTVPVVTRR